MKYIVMWNVRSDTPEMRTANIEKHRAEFLALREKIPGLI